MQQTSPPWEVASPKAESIRAPRKSLTPFRIPNVSLQSFTHGQVSANPVLVRVTPPTISFSREVHHCDDTQARTKARS